MSNDPKVLFLDIETSPILAYAWGLFDQNISLNQIYSDWHLLSWCAKFKGCETLFYKDQRTARDMANDRAILRVLWNLLDQADIVVGHNSKRFDVKKINARFLAHGFQPPSSYRQVDTLELAKKSFALTSNKLEYLAEKLGVGKKSKHKEFEGFELWKECLKGNPRAWAEMEKYNKMDVIVLEGVYNRLQPWGIKLSFNPYRNERDTVCACGSERFKLNGHFYTETGKFQRYRCLKCGSESRDGVNLFSKEKRKSLRKF